MNGIGLNPGVKPFKMADWRHGLQHIDLVDQTALLDPPLETVSKMINNVPSLHHLRDAIAGKLRAGADASSP